MTDRKLALVVLVAAVAAFAGSIAWASSRADGPNGWTMNRYGPGMMGLAANGAGEPVTGLAPARRQAERFAGRLGLEVGEVMRFENNYYAELEEEDGRLATEILVDPATGAVSLEYGPAMMWNTRYGMMSDYRLRNGGGMMGGGMMGGGMGMMGSGAMGGDPTFAPSAAGADGEVSAAEAGRIAAAWLGRDAPGTTPGEADAFPGYYTLHVRRDGKLLGMLSVNAATGAVWSHSWHGRFVSMAG